MSKVNYALYAAAAARLALRLRPDVVYASDPLGAGPGLLAARLAGAALVYHEHDSPSPGMLHPMLARSRAAAARAAQLIVFPNEERARSRKANCGSPMIGCISCGMFRAARNWPHLPRQRSRR